MNKIFLEIFGRYRLIGNFTERNDRIFVVVPVHGDRRARRNRPRPVRGKKNKLETVRDFIDAIFNGDASHENLRCWDDHKIGASFQLCKLMLKRGRFMAGKEPSNRRAPFNHEKRVGDNARHVRQ